MEREKERGVRDHVTTAAVEVYQACVCVHVHTESVYFDEESIVNVKVVELAAE